MNKQVAIHFFGQLRYVEVNNNIEILVQFLNDKGIEVDLYATFWDDEYTKKHLEAGKFTNFKSVRLIPEPNVEGHTLEKYFYSLENTLDQRNKEYDFIIFSRYDLDFKIYPEPAKFFEEFYKFLLNHTNTPSAFFIPSALAGKRIDDKLFICNQKGADKICLTYSKFKAKEFDIPFLKYHTSLLDAINFFNIKLFLNLKFFSYTLIRHDYLIDIDLDQSIKYGDILLRDYVKKFQDFNEMKKFLEKVTS